MPWSFPVFFRQYVSNFQSTGSISPSTKALARALCRYVEPGESRRRVLEVGPGTGAVTSQLVTRLGPRDQLDLVELNPVFVQHLQKRFQSEPAFQRVQDRVRIITAAVQDLPRNEPYDLIVSGLPLNNFSVETVEEILSGLRDLVAPSGVVSFFEYIGIRKVRGVISLKSGRERLRGISRALDQFLEQEFDRQAILWSLPPAWVHHVRPTNARVPVACGPTH